MNHSYFFYYIPNYIFKVIFEQFQFFLVIQVLIISVLKLSFIFWKRFLELRYQSVLINVVVEFLLHHTSTALDFEFSLHHTSTALGLEFGLHHTSTALGFGFSLNHTSTALGFGFSLHHTSTALGFEPNLGWHYTDQRRLLVGKDF